MRKTFLLMSIVLSFTFMMSCSNDDEVVVPIEVPQEVDTPPIDSLKVKILAYLCLPIRLHPHRRGSHKADVI